MLTLASRVADRRKTDRSFEYLLKPDDLKYWRGSNIPVIIVVWRQSDGSAYWKDVTNCVRGEERRLKFDKDADVFDARCADRIGALTINRHTPGVYLPPLNGNYILDKYGRCRHFSGNVDSCAQPD
jgi:hypothetical protein